MRSVVLAIGLCSCAYPLAAEPTKAPAPEYVASLVKSLGDRSFTRREASARALTRIGLPAKDELLKALESPDAEVRYRAREILKQVLEVDFRIRLEAFVNDTEGQGRHDLPGWKRFRELFGDDRVARQLFAEMQTAESGLLEAAEQGAAKAASALEGRCTQLQQAMQFPSRTGVRQQMTAGTCAALLFVASDRAVPINRQTAMYLYSFCYQTAVYQGGTTGERAGALRKLVASWVQRSAASDAQTCYQGLLIANRYDLKEGLEPAMALLENAALQPTMKMAAMLAVGRFGDQEHIAKLLPLLKDETPCIRLRAGQPNAVEVQVRDVALAMAVALSGQNLKEYGFEKAQVSASTRYVGSSLQFATAAQRDAALKKWSEWWTTAAGRKPEIMARKPAKAPNSAPAAKKSADERPTPPAPAETTPRKDA